LKTNVWRINDIQRYLEGKGYPEGITKAQKRNLRAQAQSAFKIENGKLLHKTHSGKKTDHGKGKASFPDWVRVITNRKKQIQLIKIAHKGTDDSVEAASLSAHRGVNTTIDLLARRSWWWNMTTDVKSYIKTCDTCQKVSINEQLAP